MSDAFNMYEAGNKGYVLRNYAEDKEGDSFPMLSAPMIPKSDWVELIHLHREAKSSPKDVHQYSGIKPMSQKSTNYCWMYGTVACVANRLGAQGIDTGLNDLNAFATAALGKKGSNRGGYGSEACRYIQSYGIPSKSVWKEFDWDRKQYNKPEVKASADLTKLVSFEELPRQDIFAFVVSTILNPVNPCPVTLAYSHWRHLVAGMEVTYRGSRSRPEFGLTFINSWGPWGPSKNGYGTFYGQKAVPFESIAVRHVKARCES